MKQNSRVTSLRTISIILWIIAVGLIVINTSGVYTGWNLFVGLSKEYFYFFRCEIANLYSTFAISAGISLLGFLIYPIKWYKRLMGAILSLVGLLAILWGIYVISDPYDYKTDPYSSWYRDNVILDYDNFSKNIDNTAWIDTEGDIAVAVSGGELYISGLKRDGGRILSHGEYIVDGCRLMLEDFIVDNRSFSGYFSVKRLLLKNWQYTIESSSFTRIRPEDLLEYGFPKNIISRISDATENNSNENEPKAIPSAESTKSDQLSPDQNIDTTSGQDAHYRQFINSTYSGGGNEAHIGYDLTIRFYADKKCECFSEDGTDVGWSKQTANGTYYIEGDKLCVNCSEASFEFEILENGEKLFFDKSESQAMPNYMTLTRDPAK